MNCGQLFFKHWPSEAAVKGLLSTTTQHRQTWVDFSGLLPFPISVAFVTSYWDSNKGWTQGRTINYDFIPINLCSCKCSSFP